MRPALKEPCSWQVQNATTKVVLSQGALRATPSGNDTKNWHHQTKQSGGGGKKTQMKIPAPHGVEVLLRPQ